MSTSEQEVIAADLKAPIGTEARLRAQTDILLQLWSRCAREFIADRAENRIVARRYKNCDKAQELIEKLPYNTGQQLSRDDQLRLVAESDEITDPDAELNRIPAARQAWEEGCLILMVQVDQRPYGEESCLSFIAGAPTGTKMAEDQLAQNEEAAQKAVSWYFNTHDWFLISHPGFIESKVRPNGFGAEAASIIWAAQQKRCANCGEKAEKLSRCAQCHLEYYCSKDCQAKHWKATHKQNCENANNFRIILDRTRSAQSED
jgi:hypothetical protein